MVFLVPALAALCSDTALLCLIYLQHDSIKPDHPHAYLYNVHYIAPLAIIRLSLLLIPLPYHSYTGTAVKCPVIYKVFYAGTIVVVLLQMLGVMILDPDSLSTLVPTVNYRNRYLLDHSSLYQHMRQVWLVLTLNLLSGLLHLMLIHHVRSTAPTDWSQRRHVLYYFTTASRDETDNVENLALLPGPQSEWMMDLQIRFKHTKRRWTQRLEDFTRRMSTTQTSSASDNSSTNSSHQPTGAAAPLTAFLVLLKLFSYEQHILHQLDCVFDSDNGTGLTFYVPQLLSFLLHGAYHNAADLEEWILSKCKLNVYFAHRCYFFLRAWCLEASHSTTKDEVGSLSRSSSFGSLLGGLENQKYPPEERSAMQALLERVVECGEIPAQTLQSPEDSVSVTSGPLVRKDMDGSISLNPTPAAIQAAVSAGHLPIDHRTGKPSPNHVQSLIATDKMGLLPKTRAAQSQSTFLHTPKFLDTLLNLADALFLLPKEHRTTELRRHLKSIEIQHLPSNSIYIPLNSVQHRIWRIATDDCIALSTKERVPCIIALEVLDYGNCVGGRLQSPRKRGFSGTILELMRQESSDASEEPLSPIKPSTSFATPDEREAISSWRNMPRNPRRLQTLLDKVTNFTRDTARSAQESLRKIKEFQNQQIHPHDEEAQSLTSGDDAPSTPVITKRVAPARIEDLGQWSSPVITSSPSSKEKKIGAHHGLGDEEAMDALADIRQNMEAKHAFGGGSATSATDTSSGEYGATVQKQRTSKPPPIVFKESWSAKQERLRAKSAYGSDPSWRLVPILVKSNDDLRQEQLASQLIYRMASILAQENVPVWLYPYEICALTDRGGIIEAIPDTISLDSLKRNLQDDESLSQFFDEHFDEGDDIADAKANFVESLAAYSIISFLLQIKDRHNGNILLDSRGHLIQIDFGFFFLSSPGKNSGFESAPFKLTSEFCDLMGGPHSNTFRMFRELCCRTFLSLRKHCFEIMLLVEMLIQGNEDLNCFRGRPEEAVKELRERFRLDLNDRACTEYVNALVDESIENWRTRWYDRYQRFCVGVL